MYKSKHFEECKVEGHEYQPEKLDINKDLVNKAKGVMVQYSLWNNCNNKCKFCLVKDTTDFDETCMNYEVNRTIENIKYLDSLRLFEEEGTYSKGISTLGGEMFCFPNLKNKLMELVEVIGGVVTKSRDSRWSFVTNGMYDPSEVLWPMIDKIKDITGTVNKVDINFSFDPIGGFRYSNEERLNQALQTIRSTGDRYSYIVGTQMILTQKVIDFLISKNIKEWYKDYFPSKYSMLSLLYPHPIFRGNEYAGPMNLEGFNFTRSSLFRFLSKLDTEWPEIKINFISSVRNSAVFKHIGMLHKGTKFVGESLIDVKETTQLPVLADGKELITECGHSELYRCYIDSEKCMLCDLENF